MAEWQPIETAPKDGTKVFIWREGWDQAPVAQWRDYPGNPVVGSDESESADCWMHGWLFHEWFTPGIEDGWLGWNEDIDEGCMPTHWMPLPEPPKGQNDG